MLTLLMLQLFPITEPISAINALIGYAIAFIPEIKPFKTPIIKFAIPFNILIIPLLKSKVYKWIITTYYY